MVSSCFKQSLKARLEPHKLRTRFMCYWERRRSAQITVRVSPFFSSDRSCQMFFLINVVLSCSRAISRVPFSSQSCCTWSLTKVIVLEERKWPSLGSTWILALRSGSWSTAHMSVSLQSEYSLCYYCITIIWSFPTFKCCLSHVWVSNYASILAIALLKSAPLSKFEVASCSRFHRKTDNVIECTMPAVTQAHVASVSVCVEFENLPCQRDDLSTTYTYKKNPTIFFIEPTKSYLR